MYDTGLLVGPVKDYEFCTPVMVCPLFILRYGLRRRSLGEVTRDLFFYIIINMTKQKITD